MASPSPSLAVIDVGSNSERLVVYGVGPGGHLDVLGSGRSVLRLARDLVDGRLSDEAIDRTVLALQDFRAIAERAGVSAVVAAGTSAVRSASNAGVLIERARQEAGVEIRVISGEQEGRLAALGTVYGLPVDNGVVLDVGGGSIEVCTFESREAGEVRTFPLGALAVADRFLVSDPPRPVEIDALRSLVLRQLDKGGVGPLEDGSRLLGTGGTIRNLARIDREVSHYPIARLHGYVLTRKRVESLVDLLAGRRTARRRSIPGLNADRADSIVAGAVVVLAVMDHLGAADATVSGQGLREGLVYETLGLTPPQVGEVRRVSIEALVARFSTWDRDRATRRTILAERLLSAADPEAGPKLIERVGQAAYVLDIGRSIDFYERYRHTADVVIASDLAGFTHRKLALLAAVLRQGDDERARIQAYRPLVDGNDRRPVARAATVLFMADEIEQRVPAGGVNDVGCRMSGRTLVVTAPIHDSWRIQALAARYARSVGGRLSFEWRTGDA